MSEKPLESLQDLVSGLITEKYDNPDGPRFLYVIKTENGVELTRTTSIGDVAAFVAGYRAMKAEIDPSLMAAESRCWNLERKVRELEESLDGLATVAELLIKEVSVKGPMSLNGWCIKARKAMAGKMLMDVNPPYDHPCVEGYEIYCGDDVVIDDCDNFTGASCAHLQRGGTWENCESGGLSWAAQKFTPAKGEEG